MNIIEFVEKEIAPVKRELDFEVGDTVKVHYKIIEGNRERVQIFEGIVIAINNKGTKKTFTVRRISYDIGVERVFPLFSPRISKIEPIRKGKTRRAKLYFLRERTGKSAKLKEKKKRAQSKSKSAAKPEIVQQEPPVIPVENTEVTASGENTVEKNE